MRFFYYRNSEINLLRDFSNEFLEEVKEREGVLYIEKCLGNLLYYANATGD